MARLHKLVHLSVNTLIGAGGMNYRDSDFNVIHNTEDSFFVAEPSVELELNIASFH